MKKFLTMTLALSLLLSSAALAENVPTPHFGSQSETATEETVEQDAAVAEEVAEPETETVEAITKTAATNETDATETSEQVSTEVEYTAPEGIMAYQYMMRLREDEVFGFMVDDWTIADTAQATNPAEKSLTVRASKGNKVLDVKIAVELKYKAELNFAEPVFSVVDGTGREYPSNVWIESPINQYSPEDCANNEVFSHWSKGGYLVPLDGMKFTSSYNQWYRFFLMDCTAEIPEGIVGTDLPLYIVIHNMGENDYYVRIQ